MSVDPADIITAKYADDEPAVAKRLDQLTPFEMGHFIRHLDELKNMAMRIVVARDAGKELCNGAKCTHPKPVASHCLFIACDNYRQKCPKHSKPYEEW